jgi:antirestriction protein ArdC
MNQEEIYKRISQRIIETIEQEGVLPWRKPWKVSNGSMEHAIFLNSPKNLISGKPYRGINRLILSGSKYQSPYWVTAKQAESCGGTVTGKPETILFTKFIKKEKEGKNGETKERTVPFLRIYEVWNTDQVNDIKHKRLSELETEPEEITEPEEVEEVMPAWERRARMVLETYSELPDTRFGGNRACYSPFFDFIQMPFEKDFDSTADFFDTYFHEISHSTGHQDRLKRDIGVSGFGSESYSFEELIAEISSAFICGVLGIDNDLKNAAAYVKGWLKFIKLNSVEFVQAVGKAQTASDYILSRSQFERPELRRLGAFQKVSIRKRIQ